MNTIRVNLITGAGNALSRIDLPAVPRIGDHLRLDAESTYEVTRVLWDLPADADDLIHQNMSEIRVFLKPAACS